MPDALVAKNLVRWNQGDNVLLGVVTQVEQQGRRVAVRFDDDSDHVFTWPSEVLERAELPEGEHVRVLTSGSVGVVSGIREHDGIALYQVSLPGGQTPTVMEDGLRPATITDPIARLRAGELHSTRSTNLRVAATRLLFAYRHAELSTLGNSRVEMKPHQIGVVHRVAESYPHRFILADEVGLGKTIEAGLLIRELRARGVADRVLVLAPSGLVGQWQHELKTKFNLAFSLYNGDSVRWLKAEHPSENIWTVRDAVIASTSYASWDEDRRHDIAGAGWDMVIIDEAHHARRTFEGKGKYSSTKLYRLAQALADPDLARAQSMLLLTATPMQLHRFELYSLIELLDPAMFPTFEDFDQHAHDLRGLNETVELVKRWEGLTPPERQRALDSSTTWLDHDPTELAERAAADGHALVAELEAQHRLSQVMVRNRKRVVGGFMPRQAAIWEVELTEREWEAYWATTHYLQTGYARSRVDKNNALGFLMATFQKLNASSSHALKRSLIRRIEKLEAVTEAEHRDAIIEDTLLEESPTAEALDDLLAERVDADWEEVRELEGLVALLEEIELDSKTRVLLERLDQIAAEDADAKVIVFTQFRDTQDYLRDNIGGPWTVHLFHGQLKPKEKDTNVARFRDGSGPQLLISTEAGGEGRNFQFSHIIINYDLPWNPMKVEQRIGRVDRIGQKHPVAVFNFSTKGTIEERVVDVLTARIGVFEETIGGLDPILGNVESDLRRILLLGEEEAKKQMAALESQLETRVADARATEERLADFIMDTRSYRKEEVEELLGRPRAVEASDVKRFVLGALNEIRVGIDRDPEHEGVYLLSFNDLFEHLFPDEVKAGRTRRITFDLSVALEREEVDFLAFGHPIVDGLVDYVRDADYGGVTSYRRVLSDEVESRRGWLFVYALELRGLTTTRELLPVFIGEDATNDPELARWLLDRSMGQRREEFGEPPALPAREADFETAVTRADSEAVTRLLERQAELESTNAGRLAEERSKRERLYDYRAQAAADKLQANRRTYERLAASDEEADRRILPVWEKNVETAQRMVEATKVERQRRLAELDGRDRVTAQHEIFAASFVSIEPDPEPLFEQARVALSPGTFDRFRRLCHPATATEINGLIPELAKRRTAVLKLAQRHEFNVRLAVEIADALAAVIKDASRLSGSELNLLHGAVAYFLEIEDEAHDLRRPDGFADDARVTNIVLEVIGRPELRVDVDAEGEPLSTP
jgi:ATP-dependent helicase HepA